MDIRRIKCKFCGGPIDIEVRGQEIPKTVDFITPNMKIDATCLACEKSHTYTGDDLLDGERLS